MELGNYKIKVTTEVESKEVCNLMEQLGFKIYNFDNYDLPCLIATWDGHYSDYKFNHLYGDRPRQELTLPQLLDLVVLHRNDVKDANYIGKYCGDFYVTSDGVIYGWNDIDAWEKHAATTMDFIKPIQPQPEQGLISGADALRALADGEEVEYSFVGDWFNIGLKEELGIFYRTDVAFRLKPHTITLNIEIPAPFEPTKGEEFYYLDSRFDRGFNKTTNLNGAHEQFGCWKTEEEIRQVVAALGGALKNG